MMEPIRIESASFAELPSVDELVRLAEEKDWLLIQVPAVMTVGEGGQRSDETLGDRERWVSELTPLLPAHRVWDSGFIPDEMMDLVRRRNEVGGLIPGMARFSIRRAVTEQDLEANLDLLTSAAVEYRTMANELMGRLARQLNVERSEFSKDALWHEHEQIGQLEAQEGDGLTDGAWAYFFHGMHCAFRSSTGVIVEAALGLGPLCGEDFAAFDPWFFIKFVDTSVSRRPEYRPLSAMFAGWNEAGCRTLEFMERRGVLRYVTSKGVIGSGWVLEETVEPVQAAS